MQRGVDEAQLLYAWVTLMINDKTFTIMVVWEWTENNNWTHEMLLDTKADGTPSLKNLHMKIDKHNI